MTNDIAEHFRYRLIKDEVTLCELASKELFVELSLEQATEILEVIDQL